MISMNAFTREPEALVKAQVAAAERVVRSGYWILGNEVKAFEHEWSEWSGCDHTIGVGNGMDALEIGMRALGVGPGDEVITTPMTAFATVLAILRTGATPVLADIDPQTAILSVDSVARCIGANTKAVMVVHLYGQSAPLDRYEALCKTHRIHLIEDCAQAHGACFQGRRVGTVGAFAGWSFYPTKNLGTIGDGGALSTQNAEISEMAKKLRNYGQTIRYYHPLTGLNSRLDELHAAILRERLKYLDRWNARRREIAHLYSTGISNPLIHTLPLPTEPLQHVHHLFVVTCPQRDDLAVFLKDRNVESLIHYPVPVHHQEPCRNLRIDPYGLLNTEKHARECMSLPCNPFLTDEEIFTIINHINAYRG